MYFTHANQVRRGSFICIDHEECKVVSSVISSPGKHGHSKARITCVGLFTGKKRVVTKPGDERVEVPEVRKARAFITDIDADIALVDEETFENFEMQVPEGSGFYEAMLNLKQRPERWNEATVEYWEVEGKKIITKIKA